MTNSVGALSVFNNSGGREGGIRAHILLLLIRLQQAHQQEVKHLALPEEAQSPVSASEWTQATQGSLSGQTQHDWATS